MGQRFEELEIWRDSFELAAEIYKAFEKSRDFVLKDQITRSAISVPSNISEGYERNSNGEFIHFLKIAKGSCGELRTQLRLAMKIGHLTDSQGNDFLKRAESISAMIAGFIKARTSFS